MLCKLLCTCAEPTGAAILGQVVCRIPRAGVGHRHPQNSHSLIERRLNLHEGGCFAADRWLQPSSCTVASRATSWDGAAVTARRFHALAAVGGDDDMFSSDLLDDQLEVSVNPWVQPPFGCEGLPSVGDQTVLPGLAIHCYNAPADLLTLC